MGFLLIHMYVFVFSITSAFLSNLQPCFLFWALLSSKLRSMYHVSWYNIFKLWYLFWMNYTVCRKRNKSGIITRVLCSTWFFVLIFHLTIIDVGLLVVLLPNPWMIIDIIFMALFPPSPFFFNVLLFPDNLVLFSVLLEYLRLSLGYQLVA